MLDNTFGGLTLNGSDRRAKSRLENIKTGRGGSKV